MKKMRPVVGYCFFGHLRFVLIAIKSKKAVFNDLGWLSRCVPRICKERLVMDLWQWRWSPTSFWIRNDNDDDARRHWKKWQCHVDLLTSVCAVVVHVWWEVEVRLCKGSSYFLFLLMAFLSKPSLHKPNLSKTHC